MQGEDPAHVGEAACGEDVEGAAGGLLGGLEDEPDPAGQRARGGLFGQVQAGAEQDGGVHVVAARMTGVRDGGAVGDVLLVGHGQRVQVRAQRDHGLVGVGVLVVQRADVDGQAGALGQDHRAQAGRGQAQRDPAGGAVLGVGQLGMGVQVAAELDQLVLVSGQERIQIRGQISFFHAQHPPACRTYRRRTP